MFSPLLFTLKIGSLLLSTPPVIVNVDDVAPMRVPTYMSPLTVNGLFISACIALRAMLVLESKFGHRQNEMSILPSTEVVASLLPINPPTYASANSSSLLILPAIENVASDDEEIFTIEPVLASPINNPALSSKLANCWLSPSIFISNSVLLSMLESTKVEKFPYNSPIIPPT